MTGADPRESGIDSVHLWAHEGILRSVPDAQWLVKHEVEECRKSILRQLWWQYATLPRLMDKHRCGLIFNTDAGSVCPSPRSAAMSQDMLSFEPGEMQRYGFSRARLRLELLRGIQGRTLRRSRLAIFLTEYARKIVTSVIGRLERSVVIPHGVDESFLRDCRVEAESTNRRVTNLVYVSNAAPYKHQWNIIEASHRLRQDNVAVRLSLVGAGHGASRERVRQAILRFDPKGEFVTLTGKVRHEDVASHLDAADVFVYASSCENMPVTLLEGMAAALPICCSDRGPMPEVLGDCGGYFDPEDVGSIVNCLRQVVESADLRDRWRRDARRRASLFTWHGCSRNTWQELAKVCD